jgi:hypothetical protein
MKQYVTLAEANSAVARADRNRAMTAADVAALLAGSARGAVTVDALTAAKGAVRVAEDAYELAVAVQGHAMTADAEVKAADARAAKEAALAEAAKRRVTAVLKVQLINDALTAGNAGLGEISDLGILGASGLRVVVVRAGQIVGGGTGVVVVHDVGGYLGLTGLAPLISADLAWREKLHATSIADRARFTSGYGR